MAGTVTRYRTSRGDARWKARWDIAQAPGLPRRQGSKAGFASRSAAQEWLRQVHDARQRGAQPSAQTLAEWLERWSPPNLAPETAHKYAQTCRNWLVPTLGRVALRDLTTEHVEALHAALSGRSTKTARNVHGVLRSALRDAERRGLVAFNVAARVPAPRARGSRELDVWDQAQLARFLSVARSAALAPLWRLAATTGLRRGELCGLHREDLGLGVLHVRRAVSEVGGRLVTKEPKTRAGLRTLALDDSTAAALANWTTERAMPQNAPLFDTRPNRLTKAFPRLAAKAGLPRLRLHDLRHTYATLALSQCRTMGDVKTLSRRLGHASVTITLDTYGHAMAQQDEYLASAVSALL